MTPQLFSLLATAPQACRNGFFGLRPWYYYLPDNDFGVKVQTGPGQFQTFPCDINNNFSFLGNGSDLPLVALAIVDDLLRIAGIAAVAFIIYGGIQYVASQGNPEKTTRARSTIVNALTGLAFALVAIAFVTFLGNQLGG